MISEPTSAKILTATAGALTFRIEVAGRSAHGSMRKEGVSAFEAFLPIHAALLAFEAERNRDPDPLFVGEVPYALSVGMVTAGEWSSNVPDRLVAEGRFGVQIGEDPRLARARFEDVVNEVAVKDPWLRENRPIVTWPGGQFASGSTDADHPLIGEMSTAVAATGGAHPPLAAGRLRQRPAALHRHRRHPHAALRPRRHRRRARPAGEGRPRPAGAGHPRADGARAAQVRDRRVSDDDLWFAGVTGQAAAVASGQVARRRAGRRRPRAHPAVRRAAQRLHHGAGRGGPRRGSRPGHAGGGARSVARRTRGDQGGARRRRPGDDVRGTRQHHPGRGRRRGGAPAARGRGGRRGQDEHAGVRAVAVHRVGGARHHPQPVGHPEVAGRLERRDGRRGGGRAGRRSGSAATAAARSGSRRPAAGSTASSRSAAA